MALRAYLIGVGLEAGLALACALPFALVGLWRARERRGAWGALAVVGALVVAQVALVAGLVSGWVRDRTDSVWPSVVGHNLSNLVVPIATLAARLG